jgi:hypothetical protein
MTRADLIERLEKASGPALVLDGEIWCAVNGYQFERWDGAGCVYRDPQAPAWKLGISHAPASVIRPYTGSLDAAVALVERELPGMTMHFLRRILERVRHIPVPYVPATDSASSWIARQLAIAFLRALEAQEDNHG